MSAFLSKLFTLIISFFWDKIIVFFYRVWERREQAKIDEDNVKKYEEAIEKKLPSEERVRRAEDLLNGTKSDISN